MTKSNTKTSITKKEIKAHIQEKIENWLFTGHVSQYHLNATAEELQARLGKYDEDGKLITCSSSFLDTWGDDIVAGIGADLQSRSARILDWLVNSNASIAKLYFCTLPDGVSGVIYSIYKDGPQEANGYLVILCKNEQKPFYLLNAYPV